MVEMNEELVLRERLLRSSTALLTDPTHDPRHLALRLLEALDCHMALSLPPPFWFPSSRQTVFR